MANVCYPKFKSAAMKSLIADMSAGGTNVKALAVDLALYTYNVSHEFISDIPSQAIVARSANLSSKTVSAADGTFSAATATFTAVTGPTFEAVILAIDTGTDSTSRLFLYLDSNVINLPGQPNGTDITLGFNASGIYKP